MSETNQAAPATPELSKVEKGANVIINGITCGLPPQIVKLILSKNGYSRKEIGDSMVLALRKSGQEAAADAAEKAFAAIEAGDIVGAIKGAHELLDTAAPPAEGSPSDAYKPAHGGYPGVVH